MVSPRKMLPGLCVAAGLIQSPCAYERRVFLELSLVGLVTRQFVELGKQVDVDECRRYGRECKDDLKRGHTPLDETFVHLNRFGMLTELLANFAQPHNGGIQLIFKRDGLTIRLLGAL